MQAARPHATHRAAREKAHAKGAFFLAPFISCGERSAANPRGVGEPGQLTTRPRTGAGSRSYIFSQTGQCGGPAVAPCCAPHDSALRRATWGILNAEDRSPRPALALANPTRAPRHSQSRAATNHSTYVPHASHP